jgi:hypothetical protein
MTRTSWAKQYAKELWRNNHAEIIAIVTAVGFWVASLRAAERISIWAWFTVAATFIYVVYILRETYLTTKAVYGVVDIPYSIVTHKSVEEADLMFSNHLQALLDQKIPVERVFERFLIAPGDWQFFDQNRIEERWTLVAKQIRDDFIRLSKRVTAPARFHFFFVTPATIAMALGATVGRDVRCKAYQYFGPRGFVPVFDPERNDNLESYHRLQGFAGEYKEISIKGIGNESARHVAILLQFVGHPLSPIGDTIKELYQTILITHAIHPGHLPATLDWMQVATELGSVILKQVAEGKCVHLFVGLPTVLAFALGYILGDHNPIHIYQYDKLNDRYICAFRLNQLM